MLQKKIPTTTKLPVAPTKTNATNEGEQLTPQKLMYKTRVTQHNNNNKETNYRKSNFG